MNRETLEVLRVPSFRCLVLGRLCSGTAMMLARSTIYWQVWELTGREADFALLGLLQFLPMPIFSLIGGALADSHDRRRQAVAAQVAALLGSAALLFMAVNEVTSLAAWLSVAIGIAVASCFENPARVALLPLVVPRGLFARAVTVHSAVQSSAFMLGPTLSGFAIDHGGVALAYAIQAGLLVASLALLAGVRAAAPEGERRAPSLRGILEGLSFVRRSQVLLGSMTLDMFAVIFGGATAMLPIYATDVLAVGPAGYGILSAASELGALVMSVILLYLPPVRRMGRVLLAAVAVYALATIAFGLSRSFPLSLACYLVVGMADYVSVVMRASLVQLSTPDPIRGRVSSINMIFIGASNQLGVAESGFVAAYTSATFSVVSGGAAATVVVLLVALFLPDLRRHRRD